MDDLAFEEMLRTEFLQEAQEILQSFEMSLLKLETASDQAPLLNEMFRYAHSLKGSGLAAGFAEFGAFAHKVENLLDQMRSGSVQPSKRVIDALLAGVDALKAFADLLRADPKAVLDSTPQEQQILACRTADSVRPEPEPAELVQEEGINNPASLLGGEEQFGGEEESFLLDAKPIVYVCEDEPNIREDVMDLFPKTWIVKGFENPDALIDEVRTQEPHLIISDLRLPGMDGSKMIASLQKEKFFTPVIFISGFADREHLVRFVKLHAFDFFEKPFDHDELLASAQKAIRARFQAKTLEEISLLAFRHYMKFNTLHEILEGNTIEPAKLKKIREMETVMIRIGNLCSIAGKFGQG